MSESIYFTARQVMDELKEDPIGLYHLMQNGLPAEYPSRLGWRKLEVQRFNPFDHDFEKKIYPLRFWKRHVELWKMGGREALHEGTRMYYPDMDDVPKISGHGESVPKEPKQKRYVEVREECRKVARSLWKKLKISRKDMAKNVR